MKYNIRGSKLEVTDAIRNYIETKLNKLERYFEDKENINVNVLIKTQGIDQKVEVTIPIKKTTLRSEESNKDLYAAIDLVTDKLERQIRKNKTRLKKRETKENIIEFIDFEVTEEEQQENTIVKRKTIDLKPMSEEEAILQMNMLGHEFFVFEDADTNSNAVLYRRKDGNYGIIDMNKDFR
jgi:ribosomal subunit interface protein